MNIKEIIVSLMKGVFTLAYVGTMILLSACMSYIKPDTVLPLMLFFGVAYVYIEDDLDIAFNEIYDCLVNAIHQMLRLR